MKKKGNRNLAGRVDEGRNELLVNVEKQEAVVTRAARFMGKDLREEWGRKSDSYSSFYYYY